MVPKMVEFASIVQPNLSGRRASHCVLDVTPTIAD
jgi:hypothetical protein